jgi:hypothetical protein
MIFVFFFFKYKFYGKFYNKKGFMEKCKKIKLLVIDYERKNKE